jgi:hypothetical protein
MKVYTEINYKWLDGQLVKTDSKSFEYEGIVALCGGGGGGGKGGGGGGPLRGIDVSTLNLPTLNDINTQLENTLEDNNDTLAQAESAINTNVDSGGDAVDKGLDVITDETDRIQEGIHTTAAGAGDAITTNMKPLVRASDQAGQYSLDRVLAGSNYLDQKLNEVSDFINGPSSPGDVKVNKQAIKGSKKKKSASDLAVNKSKTRSRKSLRIS